MDSKGKLTYGIILMIFSSICTCCGQLCWKVATTHSLMLFFYIIGLGLYGIGAVLMMVAFRFGEMSILHPMLSIGYVLSLFLGVIALGESVSMKSMTGVGMILLGLVFLGQASKERK